MCPNRQRELKRIIASKRILLVLDLDHTLLNSTREVELSQEQRETLMAMVNDKVIAFLGTCMNMCSC